MRKNIYDEALKGVSKTMDDLSDSISKEFMATKPYDQKKMTDEEQLQLYDTLTAEDFKYIMQTYGEEVVRKRLDEIARLMMRRQENAQW